MERIDIVWSWEMSAGTEHLRLEPVAGGITAEGLVVALLDEQPYRLSYRVALDERWRVRALDLAFPGIDDRSLSLRADGAGHWSLPSGEALPELTGCIDIDIRTTPFTNSLPIRRLELQPGQSAEIQVVYIPVPSLAYAVARQRYTCLQQEPGGAVYRYEGLGTNFTADLAVDRDGLVVDYPGLWRRASSRFEDSKP
jgi:hypothetical protein